MTYFFLIHFKAVEINHVIVKLHQQVLGGKKWTSFLIRSEEMAEAQVIK